MKNKNKKINKIDRINKIIGIISAHGRRSIDNTYVVIPHQLDYLLPLAPEDTNLKFGKHFCNLDMDCFYSNNDRSLINIDNFFETKPYLPGFVLKNITLKFCVEWNNGDCHDTGIFSTGNFRGSFIKKNNFKNDSQMQQELMSYHDKDIYPCEQLWRKEKNLGDILYQIIKSKKYGGYIGIFCRGLSQFRTETIPKFVSIDITSDIYYSNFYDKLEEMEICVTERNFTTYSLDIIEPSKLKYRITFDEICREIRNKLTYSCTISSYDFHSVIQIYHTKIIPIECVTNSFKIKLVKLIECLNKFNLDNIFLEADILKSIFKYILLSLCKKFLLKLNYLMFARPNQLDIIVYVVENILNGNIIAKCYCNDIMNFAKNLKIDFQVDLFFNK